ncbi:MAG: MBL fold metallo-hydrolase, partial [Patescibacteria group bacterium]
LIKDKECLIIDPGDSADFLLEEISRKNLTVVAMLATHGHFDHVMAAGEIQAALDVPFYISDKDSFLLKRVGETAKYFLGYTPEILPLKDTTNLRQGKLQVSSFELQVQSTPGHTPGSTCFYFPEDGIIFTGDTLFKDGIGRYDFSYSSKKDLFGSIKQILETIPEEVVMYSGHGDEVILQEVKTSHSSLFH